MSDYDQDEHDGRDYRHGRSSTGKSDESMDLMGYFSNFDGKLNKMINSMFCKVASGWIGQLFGLDLKNVVLGVCIFTAAQVYSVKALDWLESNGTNTVSISHNETLDTDLEMWVAQQPSM
jgi:hypothetical protein